MNSPLRRVAIAMFVLFALLFVNLNWVQYVHSDALRKDPRNRRVLLNEYSTQRGSIVVDGEAVASVQKTEGRLQYLRTYPASKLYSAVTGYKSPLYGDSGIEQAEDSVLSGDDDRLFVRQLSDTITGRKRKGGNVVLTISRPTQQAAFDALGGRRGAIVALDPQTGKILALVSGPSYDPNPLASHDDASSEQAWQQLDQDQNKPLLNRALNETYPPGSTFKVIVSAAALKEGYNPASTVDSPMSYTPPQTTRAIQNFAGESCGGDHISLEHALTVSCNTAYAKLGVDLGRDKVMEQAREFGFETKNQECPLKVSPSELGDISDTTVLGPIEYRPARCADDSAAGSHDRFRRCQRRRSYVSLSGQRDTGARSVRFGQDEAQTLQHPRYFRSSAAAPADDDERGQKRNGHQGADSGLRGWRKDRHSRRR